MYIFALVLWNVSMVTHALIIQPPTSGSFFYMDLYTDQNNDLYTNLYAGKQWNPYQVQFSTCLYNLHLWDSKCRQDICTTGPKYNETDRDFEVYETQEVEFGQILEGYYYKINYFQADESNLEQFGLRYEKYEREANSSLVLLPLKESQDGTAWPFITEFSGLIGLQPYNENHQYPDQNFMYQLKKNGLIDHMVASFYVNPDQANSSHVKFGSFDQQSVAVGQNLTVLRTLNSSTWALQGLSQKVGGHDIFGERTILIEPQFKYTYIPRDDYIQFVAIMASTIYHQTADHLQCNANNVCYFTKSCDWAKDHVTLHFMEIQFKDSEGTVFKMDIEASDLLVSPEEMGYSTDEDICFVGVFQNENGNKDTWVIGSKMIQDYYIVYDQTPFDERFHDYIQIGMALKNPADVGPHQYYEDASEYFDVMATTEDVSQWLYREDDTQLTNPDAEENKSSGESQDQESYIGLAAISFIMVFFTIFALCYCRQKEKNRKGYSTVQGDKTDKMVQEASLNQTIDDCEQN